MIPMGRPEEGIVKAAEFRQASLIIVGSHGRSGLKRLRNGLRGGTGHRPRQMSRAGGEEEVTVWGALGPGLFISSPKIRRSLPASIFTTAGGSRRRG